MKPTNVCMIAYTIYSSDARVKREAETIASQPGYKVTFLALRERKLSRVYSVNGVDVRELGIRKYQGKNKAKYFLSYLSFLLMAFQIVNKLLFKNRIDIVHIHNMPNYLVFAAIIPRLFGKKLILDIHDSTPETYLAKFNNNRRQRVLFKLLCIEEYICCRIAHKIICVNQLQRDVLVARGIDGNKVLILMNIPDTKIFNLRETDTIENENHERFQLIYHGTVTKRLGIDLAIRAVHILKNRIPQLKFFILGLGDDIDEFNELSKELGVESNIYFNKRIVPVEEVIENIRRMDIGIISNRKNLATELMLPVKMLEYMALGIPVVAPRLKAIQYYFKEDTIQYYEPEDVSSMAEAILSLYKENKQRKIRVKAASNFFKVYGWEKHRQGLMNLYKEFRRELNL